MTLLFILLWFMVTICVVGVVLPELVLLLKVCISFLLSNTLLSFAYTASLFFDLPFSTLQVILIILPVAVFAFTVYRHTLPMSLTPRLPLILLLILLLLIYRFTDIFWQGSLAWGEWDAWAIWTLHAKFLALKPYYRELFSGFLGWSHVDYPLLLPSYLALLFRSSGSVHALIPASVAYGICMICICSIFSFFQQKGLPVPGLIFVYALVVSDLLLPIGGWQYADTLLATFICFSFILYELYAESANKTTIAVLMGFFAGACGWVKNEGLVFFLVFTFLFCLYQIRQRSALLCFLCGALLPLLFIVYFKIAFAPRGDILSSTEIIGKVTDKERIKHILTFMKEFLTIKNIVPAYLMVFVLFACPKYLTSLAFLSLTILFISYFLVYLITPNNLMWHMSTSFDRLVHQLTLPLLLTISASLIKTKSFQKLRLKKDCTEGKYL